MTPSRPENSVRCVALVEDDADDSEVFRLLLRKSGREHPLEVFRRGEELVSDLTNRMKQSAAALPLICFLDLALPDLRGLELLKWIRSHPHFDEISLVVLSASENPEEIKVAAGSGAQCFLTKYPQPAVLRRVMEEAIELAATGHPARHWFGIRENLILRWAPSNGNAPA
jgi:CheY-like chemotaxis protein